MDSNLPARPDTVDITVLIAAFNASGFLHRAVESALQQTLPATEVLIVDDASTDHTHAVAMKLAEAHPRIRVIRLPVNGGPSVARNAGLDAARGDWIAILDADDAFTPDRLARMAKVARESNADVVADNFLWFNPTTRETSKTGLPESDQIEIVTLDRFLDCARPFRREADWGLLKPMFRKQFLDQHAIRYSTQTRHGEDYLLTMAVLLAGANYMLTKMHGYIYTDRSSGQSRTQVNYDRMALDSTALLDHPSIRASRVSTQLLQQRIGAIRRLAAEYKLRTLLAQDSLLPALQLALREPRIARAFVRHGLRKLKAFLKPA